MQSPDEEGAHLALGGDRECTGNPLGIMALEGKSMTDLFIYLFTNVLLHHSERCLGFSSCWHMVVGGTRLNFPQHLSLGFEQGVSETS